MTSIVVRMISIITIIAIIGEAADLQTEIEGCPYLDNAEYEVTVKGSVSSLIGGCAYIHYNASDIKPQSFRLYFGNIHHDGQHCSDHGMEYFHFQCLSKSPSVSEDISKGRMYIRIYNEDTKKAGGRDHRCALFEKINDSEYFTKLLVAVSSDDLCDGLSNILDHPQLNPSQKKRSMLLIFKRSKPGAPRTPASATTTESIQSISDQYERRGYILQNFGNRPNPFWSTKFSEAQSEQQMMDEDRRRRAVMDLIQQ